MSNSAFWRDLAEQFEKLDAESRVRLEWTYYPSLEAYRFEAVGDTDLSRAKYDKLSMDAALTLCAGQGIDPQEAKNTWLTLVRRRSKNDIYKKGSVIEGAEETLFFRGMTERPCQISAALCYEFAAQALENEGRRLQPEPGENPDLTLSAATATTAAELPGMSSAKEPARAAWLNERLRERSWNKHDVSRHRGPDHKTVQKILDGKQVRAEMLVKLAEALSLAPATKHLPDPIVTLLQIPPN